jgi:hypothetical protein
LPEPAGYSHSRSRQLGGGGALYTTPAGLGAAARAGVLGIMAVKTMPVKTIARKALRVLMVSPSPQEPRPRTVGTSATPHEGACQGAGAPKTAAMPRPAGGNAGVARPFSNIGGRPFVLPRDEFGGVEAS